MKRTLIIIAVITISAQLFSQSKPFRFGFRAAPNLSWMSPDAEHYESAGVSMGFSWGFVSDITLTDNYFIKTGFNVVHATGKLEFPYQMVIEPDTVPVTGRMERKYYIRYLEIPATLKMRTNKFGKFAFFGMIGFSAAFKLKSKSKDKFSYNDKSFENTDNDISNETRLVKAALIAGMGIEYFIDGSTSLFAELNFNNGLNSVLKGTNPVYPQEEQKAFLYYPELSIGVLF